jgi:lipoate-protein ligase A
VGSAQKRTGAAFLQHGSIPLDKDEALLAAVTGRQDVAIGGTGMTSIAEALGRPVDFVWAVERLRGGFSEFFGVALEPYTLTSADVAGISALRDARYATPEWTFRL